MAVEVSYTALCHNNHLFIFDALKPGESQTGRRLQEDVADYANSIGRYNYCTRYVIKNKTMLVAHLKAIECECRAGVLYPALHFECHGDADKGLWISGSDEYISWAELAALITPLSAASRNNVAVVLGTCHGFALQQSVDITVPCPFHYMIAPNQEITAGVIYDSLLPFYKEIVSTGELEVALKCLDGKFKFFCAGEWFYSMIATFYTNSYSLKDKEEMMNRMIDNEVAKAGYSNRQLIRSARVKIKKYLNNPRVFYSALERCFFHGQAKIPYDELKRFVDEQKAKR
ncbi:hypothetical protein [Pseudomonas alloputida]|uniref:hypothetical protein n=1 Tax=Pseudomonas alloputida TaxID=1940621 RepID=UPI001E3802BA|nr:hypothetical protein [Pseudomonas alloputida]MCE1054964.1 hypothetical protein [Pseudomonas alloputida]